MKLERASTSDQRALKIVTFDANANTGAVGDVPLFTVTGKILVVSFVPICTTIMAENGATTVISLGVTDVVALFIANTEPEDIDANEIWTAVDPTGSGEVLPASLMNVAVNGTSNNILATVVNDTVTSGVMEFYLTWRPLSGNGLVVPA